MLIRLLIVIGIVPVLLVACGDDQSSSPAVAPTAPQVDQQQEQASPSDLTTEPEQSQDSARARAEQEPQQTSRQTAEEPAQPEPQTDDRPRELETSSRPGGPPEPEFNFERALQYLEHLAGALGPRATGTEQERVAAEYLAETLSSLGYDVEIQEFSFVSQAGIGRIDAPDGFSTFAFRFTGSSNDPSSGELVNVPGVGQASDYATLDVVDKIVIVDRGSIQFHVKAANAEAAGAVGLIIANRTLTESLGGTLGTQMSEIPVLQISKEAGDEIRLRLGMTVSIPESSPNSGDSQNVIARKPGGACRVVVGGHYDTVPDVDGANDNASGTALTLALAEVWSEHPSATDICFVGFGAEELGLHGSAAFVRRLRTEDDLPELSAMLNLDAIGDGRAPYRIVSSFQLQEIANSVAADLQINAGLGDLPMQVGSDHASFARLGIPVVFVFPPGARLHTPLDNLDNVDHELYADISELNHGILACLLERAGSRIAPTLSCGSE